MATLDMPGSLADHIREGEFDGDAREALDAARTIERGRSYSLRITAPLEIHRLFLDRCWTLAGGPGIESTPAERKAHRAYSQRIDEAADHGQ